MAIAVERHTSAIAGIAEAEFMAGDWVHLTRTISVKHQGLQLEVDEAFTGRLERIPVTDAELEEMGEIEARQAPRSYHLGQVVLRYCSDERFRSPEAAIIFYPTADYELQLISEEEATYGR